MVCGEYKTAIVVEAVDEPLYWRDSFMAERIEQAVERRLRKWYWRNADSTWFMEVRYGNRALKLSGENTAIEVGEREKLTEVIGAVKDAVMAGELDKILAAAKKERMTMLRKG